jgi:hypothetical protein
VGKADGFDEVGVYVEIRGELGARLPEIFADRSPYLCHFERMRKPCSVEIIFAREEHLCFSLHPPKSGGVNNPVTVDFKRGSIVLTPLFCKALDVERAVKSVFGLLLHRHMECCRIMDSLPVPKPGRAECIKRVNIVKKMQ